jgi:predicted O-methyltransferase YrrM
MTKRNIATALTIKGWMGEGELLFLAEEASKHKKIVEAGVFCGRSLRAMADNTNGIVYAVDPWDGSEYDNPSDLAYQEYLKTGGLTVFSEFSVNLFEHIVDGTVRFERKKFKDFYIDDPDMIFIDAIHKYENVKEDIHHALKLLRSGGLLCGHDYTSHWPEVIKAVDEIFGKDIHVTEGIWWINL